MGDYRKFMILSSPRSGTHMLKSSIDNHPNAVCLTEMFNPDYTEKIYPFTEYTPEQEILDGYIFCEYPPEVQAVGFCLHRVGARFGNWPDLWEMLVNMEDLYIISLRRENLLRRYWSFQLRTIQDLRNQSPEPRALDKDRLIADFERQTSRIAEFDEKFKDHPLITVTYEQLCNDYGPTLNRVQEFLGLDVIELQPGTNRRATPKISEKVTNYDELKREFEGTPWAHFFDD